MLYGHIIAWTLKEFRLNSGSPEKVLLLKKPKALFFEVLGNKQLKLCFQIIHPEVVIAGKSTNPHSATVQKMEWNPTANLSISLTVSITATVMILQLLFIFHHFSC